MTNRAQVFCAVSGPFGLLLFLLAMWPASHFLPPPAPGLTPTEVVEVYRSHTTGIQIAAILQMVSISLLAAFYGGISAVMRRMEGNDRTWTYVQLGAGAMSLAPFLLCGLLWAAAALRPDRAPEITQVINDFAFLFLVAPAPPATVQLIAIGYAILGDKNPQPVFPRWLAFATFWTAILILPGAVVVMFMRGPFAWNGVLGFWIPAIVFGIWANVMGPMMIKAAKQPSRSTVREPSLSHG
jgi:hypothetical protein